MHTYATQAADPCQARRWQVSSAVTLKEWQNQCLSGVSVTSGLPPGCWIQFGAALTGTAKCTLCAGRLSPYYHGRQLPSGHGIATYAEVLAFRTTIMLSLSFMVMPCPSSTAGTTISSDQLPRPMNNLWLQVSCRKLGPNRMLSGCQTEASLQP